MKHQEAKSPERRGDKTKLLLLDKQSGPGFTSASHLADAFRSGDRLVVNDVATLPSSFRVRLVRTGEAIELRLAALRLIQSVSTPAKPTRWRAVLFDGADWRTSTERRSAPPVVNEGDELEIETGFFARVLKVDREISSRLLEIDFGDEPGLWEKLWRNGRPIQYSYLTRELHDWDQQTLFSSLPLAVEPPSASFALTWDLIHKLRAKGVEILSITHGTGLSDTGDSAINAKLPFDEVSIVPRETQRSLRRARDQGARIVAAGTGVARALESWAWRVDGGQAFTTSLKITQARKLKVSTGLLTGLHETGASHLDLLAAFIEPAKLEAAYRQASEMGYLWHEYGDLCLVI